MSATPRDRCDRASQMVQWLTLAKRLQLERDLDDLPELAQHLEENYDDLLARGSRARAVVLAQGVEAAKALCTRAEAAESVLQRVRVLVYWHETEALKARAVPGDVPINAALMNKAAQVHEDAARRIRRALDGE